MKRILHAIPFWLGSAFLMLIIFKFSSQTGEQSAQVSKSLLDIIIEFLGTIMTEHILRKLAHFSEFAALGFFMSGSFYFTFNKIYSNMKMILLALIPCVLYAISDEIHQLFVPERACQALDVLIDSSGCLLGILIFIVIIYFNRKRKNSCTH